MTSRVNGDTVLARRNSLPIALLALPVAVAVAACGGSGIGSPSSASTSSPTTAAATPTAALSSGVCPTGATIGSALGITLPNAVVVAGGTHTLPSGATGLACDYHGAADNVIIELITNVSPTLISQFSMNFPGGYKTVAGVGDQARSFLQPLGPGKDNEGVVATKGSTLVAITATATPASLAQVEALVNQLL